MSTATPMDDNDLHQAGERPDPFEDGMEDATPKSRPMLRPRAELFTSKDLEEAESRDLLALASLPMEHGWGTELDAMLGGGLAPGMLIALGASRAGAGKTAFLMQLADGLALRCAELVADDERAKAEGWEADKSAPLTPVLILSEMSPSDLSFRSLGRLRGVPARLFRSGPAATRASRAYYEGHKAPDPKGKAEADTLELFRWAKGEVERGALNRIATWQRMGRPDSSGKGMLELIALEVNAWRDELTVKHGRDVWPVVVVDPIQRWQDSSKPEVEALNELVETLDALADEHGWIAFMTSDTNKDAAKVATVRKSNEPERLASPALFRGSYKLHHSADVVMVLQPNPPSLPESVRADGTRESWAAVALDKNRWGPIDRQAFFKWERASGRFKAVDDPGSEVRDAFEGRGEEKEAAGARGAGHKTGGMVQI